MDETLLNDLDLRYWLALVRAPGFGPAKLNPLVSTCASVEQLFRQPPAETPALLRSYLHNPDWHQVDQDQKWLNSNACSLIPITSLDYPALLKTASNPPTVLFVMGNPALLQQPQIAIVGSRNPSKMGAQTATAFSHELCNAGLCITSGLALGIDTASHLGALQNQGTTIAVTGTGLDRVYPASNRELAHQICEHGALVSEFPPGTAPKPGNFPRRNRIISGLSVGTLVVEAALKSGSLITAQRALEQGREVFAIPGSIHNPLARGCHSLIRQGAKLVENTADILEELASLLGTISEPEISSKATSSKPSSWDPEYQQLLETIGYDPISIDKLIEQTGFPPESVSSMLLLLEMSGHVSSAPGGHYVRT